MNCKTYLPCAVALLSALLAVGCGGGGGSPPPPTPPTITINDMALAEGDAATTTDFVFTVTLSKAPDAGADVTVDWATANGTATTADNDYVAANGTLTFTSGGPLTQTVTVVVNGDATVEDNETLTVTLSNAVNATIADAQGVGTITNDDATSGVTITITDDSELEGTNLVFDVTISAEPAASMDVTVDWATADGTATVADGDYTPVTATTLTFTNGGALTQQVTVVVTADTTVESDETLTVDLSTPVNATISDPQGQGTIQNDDLYQITVGDVSLDEGAAGPTSFDFAVTVSPAVLATETVTVDWETTDDTATVADSDYALVTATQLTFTAGETTKTASVSVTGDGAAEPDEVFYVDLTSPSANAEIVGYGIGTILNDDATAGVTISITDESELEGTNLVFDVTISAEPAVNMDVTVDWATADGTATVADSDYTPVTATTLTFINGGALTQQVTVTVTGDTLLELAEELYVDLSNAVNATILVPFGTGTITNDDLYEITVDDVSQSEGSAGSTSFDFTVTVSPAVLAAQTVTVDWATADGTATLADGDYVLVTATQLTFTAGETTKTASVSVTGDANVEPDELFYVDLTSPSANATIVVAFGTGTVLNDDWPDVWISDAPAVAEGDAGTTDMVFDVTIDVEPLVGFDVTVDWETDDGTATAGIDYTAVTSTTLTFTNGGALMQQVTVTVTGDTLPELTEELFVDLWNPVNATISIPSGTGTILNDDAQVRCVDPTGSDGGGLTWATAYQTLGAATGELYGLGGGEVWVAAGTYTNTAAPVLFMLSDVDLYGGFDGYAGGAGAQETNRADRDWLTNATVLDGEGVRRVVDCTFASDARLDGFTVANGDAAGGAGIYINTEAFVVVANCTFLDNVSTTVAGAASVIGSTGIEFINCLFSTSTATGGGGGALRTATGSSVTLTDCTFVDNWTVTAASDHGGAIQCNGGTLVVTDCDFTANRSAGAGGALYAGSAATVLVSRCTFQGNAATGIVGHGGAIFTIGGVGIAAVSCEFSGNTADAAMDGGGVHLLNTSGELTNCVFEANAAGGNGGGAYVEASGGDYYVVITNSTFEGNQAADGGALYNYESGGILTVDVSNSIMWWNSTDTVANVGAPAVGFEYSDVDGSGGSGAWNAAFGTDFGVNIDEAPLFVNIPMLTDWTSAAGTIATVEITDASTYYAADDVIEIADDDVARTVSGVAGTTVTFGPALASASAAGVRVDNWGPGATDMVVDLRVDGGVPSPCIDAGNDASIALDTTDLDGDSDTTEDVPHDLDGLDRVQGSFVDMGAYEQ